MSSEELRTRGNDFFKKSMFHNAIDHYTKSLELSVSALTLANRAQAHLKLAHFESAYADADSAVAADGDYSKARYRRAVASLKLGFVEKARRDCEILLEENPKNKEFQKLLNDIKSAKKIGRFQLYNVKRCDTIRSETPLMEIAIEQKEVVTEAAQPQTKEKKYTVPLPAATSGQFLNDYDAMKNRDPEYFGTYLASIDATRIPGIIGEFLEGDMMSLIVNGLHAVQDKVPSEDIIDRLISVSMCARFDLVVMFLDGSERNILEEMFRRFPKDKEELLRQSYL
uniref:RNA polymerase II-associated protein 3 n=1 Tax=Steinernema glaseri TaxID=37863 RepID=A0A1I7ZIC4_9BILA